MSACCIYWPRCGADVTGQCPTPTHSDDDIAGVLANDAAAADRLLAIHNRTRGPVATVSRDDLRRIIDAHSGALSAAQSAGALPATTPPPAPPLLTADDLHQLPVAALVDKVLGLRQDIADDAAELAALRADLDRLAREYGYASHAALEAEVATNAALTARDARLDALVRRDLAATCTALRWRCAAILCATATPGVWFDMSLDLGVIAVGERNRARRNAVEQAAVAMAGSRPDRAAAVMADLCGLSVDAWAAKVEAECPALEVPAPHCKCGDDLTPDWPACAVCGTCAMGCCVCSAEARGLR